MKIKQFISGLVIIIMAVALCSFTFAQQATPTPTASIELTGPISSIEGAILTVNGLRIDTTGATINGELNTGVTVVVVGNVTPEGVITAQSVTVPVNSSTPISTAGFETASPPQGTATPAETDTIIVIEGPIQEININIITIYHMNIQVDVNNPILNLIQIGDVIYVEGAIGANGIIIASVINNLTDVEEVVEGASVGIQGSIEAIDGNRVTVNGITVQFDPNDPLLPTFVVGNFIDVQGNFILVNNVYVLVVINVIVINDIDINVGVPGHCWWHGMGMGMGHWHCDGMGMGGMGMGMGR